MLSKNFVINDSLIFTNTDKLKKVLALQKTFKILAQPSGIMVQMQRK